MSLWKYVCAKAVPLCTAAMAGLYLLLVGWLCAIPLSLLLILLLRGALVLLFLSLIHI